MTKYKHTQGASELLVVDMSYYYLYFVLKEQKSIMKIFSFLLQSQSSSANATIFKPTWYDLVTWSFPTTNYATLSVLSENVQKTFSL